ncbi:MAG: T9SS type A sorting domain-containing protein [Bacteroidota bacterium]
MKTILYTFLLFFTINLYSQPTVGGDAIVTIGEEEPTTFLPFSLQNWESGFSGPNVSWDYSSLSIGQDYDYIAMDPSDSPYFDSFPNSDLYFATTFSNSDGFVTEDHTYYSVEGDILQLAGNVSISISNPNFDSIFTVFTDPLDWATFPYSYQDNTDDTFEARITSYIGNQTIVALQTGSSTHEVDGYGTLTTPAGTFENALRVKRTELAENSIPGIPFSTPQESYRYTWYAEGENGVILNLDSIVIKDFNDNIVSTMLSGSYRTRGPNPTSTTSLNELNVSIYPNPAVDEINIELENLSDYKLYIYTVEGKLMPFSILNSSEHSSRIKLNTNDYRHGVLYLKVADKENIIKFSSPIIVGNR